MTARRGRRAARDAPRRGDLRQRHRAGRRARSEVIAKTGTAEFQGDRGIETHAWMIAAQGDLAVAVFVEVGQSGSSTAGPILEQFLRAGGVMSINLSWMSRVVGREALLAEVRELLERGESVALNGPVGVGKSALLTIIEDAASDRPTATPYCTRAAPTRSTRCRSRRCATCWPSARPSWSSDCPRRCADRSAAGLVGIDATDELRSDLAAGFHSLLARWSESRPVLMLLDDVQWLDGESSAIVGYARRRLHGRVALVATIGPGDNNEEIDVSGLHHLEVPPLPAAEMIDLLCDHGLAADVAQRVYVESGGIPSLALALCGAIGEHPSVLGAPTPLPVEHRAGAPRPVPRPARGGPRDPVAGRPAPPPDRPPARARRPARRPRSTCNRAAQSGLVCRADGAIRFTPSALRQIIAELMPADDRVALHARARRRRRHRRRAAPPPRPRPARASTPTWRASSAWPPATRRQPARARSRPSSTCWRPTGRRTTSASSGSSGWRRPSRPRRRATMSTWSCGALGDFLEATPTPAQSVRVRLAIPELAGYGVAALDEVIDGRARRRRRRRPAGREGAAAAGPDRADGVAARSRRARRPSGRSACSSAPATATSSRSG